MQQEIADKQIQAQKDIAGQQDTFNQQQLAETKRIQDLQQQAQNDQALRQTTYNTGQRTALDSASQQINDAFAAFWPDFFNLYASD